MTAYRNARYPTHLAKLVSQELASEAIVPPSEKVLLKLFEILYFASLKTDEARPCRCTVNYLDPAAPRAQFISDGPPRGWLAVPFSQPIPLDVRTLLKLADAADPTVSSIAVFSDANEELYIWGLIDQELLIGDCVALDAQEDPQRPGLFQATIAGVGTIAAYKNFTLCGVLEQNHLIAEYHDVLWEGPVNRRLRENLNTTLIDLQESNSDGTSSALVSQVKDELLIRWHNAMCRMLFNIQQYGHGGGLLIVPRFPSPNVNVKYEQFYDRLPRTLFELAQQQIAKKQMTNSIAALCQSPHDLIPYEIHAEVLECERQLERLKNDLLGCVQFIASLSCVDGFVLMDQSLVVHGFGVETRADDDIDEIFIAGDASASPRWLRQVSLTQFGTRHRAMMRYCNQHPGALGFVISQDGDIRAVMKHQGRLILWENINVQLAYRSENKGLLTMNFSTQKLTSMFQYWLRALSGTRTA